MPKEFNIIIFGSGIAGLTAALGLMQKGHKVIILKRHAETLALGGPINISLSAVDILTQYDLKDKIFEQLNPQVKDSHFRRYSGGSRLGTLPGRRHLLHVADNDRQVLGFGANNVTAQCLKAVSVCIIRCDWGGYIFEYN